MYIFNVFVVGLTLCLVLCRPLNASVNALEADALQPDECELAQLQPAKRVAAVDENSIKPLLTCSNLSIVDFGSFSLHLITSSCLKVFFLYALLFNENKILFSE